MNYEEIWPDLEQYVAEENANEFWALLKKHKMPISKSSKATFMLYHLMKYERDIYIENKTRCPYFEKRLAQNLKKICATTHPDTHAVLVDKYFYWID